MTPDDFIDLLAPAAVRCWGKYRVPASFTIAQGALESGWGGSGLFHRAYNMFGVKADKSWTGATITMTTREFIDGQWHDTKAVFRAYDGIEDCIIDHCQFLVGNHRYTNAFRFTDGRDFARQIAMAGYATDPDYAVKLISLINTHRLEPQIGA